MKIFQFNGKYVTYLVMHSAKIRSVKQVWYTSLFCLVLVSILGFSALRSSGLVSELILDLRYGSLKQTQHKLSFLNYFSSTLAQLEKNKEGVFDFEKQIKRLEGSQDVLSRAKALYHQGRLKRAQNLLEREITQGGASEEVLFWLALSYFHQAPLLEESLSSLTSSITDTKIQGPRQKAAKIFSQLFSKSNSKNRVLYTWLAALSNWPNRGELNRIFQQKFLKSNFIKFFLENLAPTADIALVDRAKQLGLSVSSCGKGAAVEDFDGDGFFDLITAATYGPTRVYKNRAGKFFDLLESTGLEQATQAYTLVPADFDNDGLIDLFVSRPFHRYQLFRNIGGMKFVDTSYMLGSIGKTEQLHASWNATWSDVDRDGDLDLFISQSAQKIPFTAGLLAQTPESSRLLINQGSTFVDNTEKFGLKKIVSGKNFMGASFGDYNQDGFPDLFLSSFSRRQSVLLKNNKGKEFVHSRLIKQLEPGYTTSFVDINQDGKLDIFQSANAHAKTIISALLANKQVASLKNTFFVQNESGTFDKMNDLFGGGFSIPALGSSFGDINNDGCFDFFLGTGNPEAWFVLPNLVYLGEKIGRRCSGYLKNVSNQSQVSTLAKGQGVVFFDFDMDGDQDIFLSQGGMWLSEKSSARLLVNEDSSSNSWVKIRLRGRQSNFFGIGASISLFAQNEKGETSKRFYHVDNKTGFGSAPFLAHIGLGKATSVREVFVDWPVSQSRRKYSVNINNLSILDENGGVLVKHKEAL